MSIEETVKKTVLKIVRKEGFDFKPTTTFKDLEADSLDVVQILVALEDSFNIEIPDEDLKAIANMGDIIAYVERKVAEKG
ncbi:MAG: acyl carrier protein [Dehalococcoidia bacterium]|nr:acyl carrier protein [Dehalococcoidia bacterium]